MNGSASRADSISFAFRYLAYCRCAQTNLKPKDRNELIGKGADGSNKSFLSSNTLYGVLASFGFEAPVYGIAEALPDDPQALEEIASTGQIPYACWKDQPEFSLPSGCKKMNNFALCIETNHIFVLSKNDFNQQPTRSRAPSQAPITPAQPAFPSFQSLKGKNYSEWKKAYDQLVAQLQNVDSTIRKGAAQELKEWFKKPQHLPMAIAQDLEKLFKEKFSDSQ